MVFDLKVEAVVEAELFVGLEEAELVGVEEVE